MRAVDAAVVAVLRAVPNLNVHTDVTRTTDASGQVVTVALPYVVYWPLPSADVTDRLSGQVSVREARWQITYVGDSPDQAKWAAEKAEAALNRRRITVGGVSLLVRKGDAGLPVRVDEDVHAVVDGQSVPLFYGADRYAVSL